MRIGKIFINGTIGKETTLKGVVSQVRDLGELDKLQVVIRSYGGYVSEGMQIHDFLKSLPVHVETIADFAYSIASNIFMAGNTRTVLKGSDRLMIHFPLIQNMTGNADHLDAVSKDLRNLEKDMLAFYVDYISDIPKETLSAFLKNETFIDSGEAVSLGFATQEIEPTIKAVAMFDTNSNTKINLMTKLQKAIEAIALHLGVSKEKEDASEAVALSLTDAEGRTVEFPDLEEGQEPSEGQPLTVDGETPEDGAVILMPNGNSITVEGGSVKTIDVPEQEEEAPGDAPEEEAAATSEQDDQLANLLQTLLAQHIDNKKTIETLKAQIVSPDPEKPDPKKSKPVAEMSPLEQRRHYKNL